ncbi:hypothetical protein L228DRAFT_239426 [Xylona heveae TC161]|uniref:Zn(2)-C6 fungal-type domain-containing protein n=1 Tax=Xylona heveae (strain CBS 132557 / TC161) TaxID=1328760 RepID=A0A165GQ95_XYLHT|nr:hypothetical protein L228DRAFT_239426 [Xylona heveae TC161]KZF22464.1 hypothetical protein L228DRAFT_239426 [Xylona heveae TC161]
MIAPSKPVRKRQRPAYSCIECRRRKVRCNRTKPCGQCTAHNLESSCSYKENRRTLPVCRESSGVGGPQQEDRRQITPEDPKSSSNSPRASTLSGPIQGTVSKTRVFGHGHWMNTYSLVEGLSSLQPIGEYYDMIFQQANHGPLDRVAETVVQCKQLARVIKQRRPSRRCLPADIHRFFPDREVINELVELYFTTFESCHQILHRPSFMTEYEDYMDHPETTESSFLVQLLLIMAAAGPLHGDANVRSEMAIKASTWMYISQTWLSAPLEKDRLTLKGVQVHCLLLLSRLVNRLGADLVWISAGSLMRMAMQMGLHQDPNHLGEMSVQQKEIRRRLWYTILEMNVQAALDSGMSPMILDGDYNTLPPSNVSDDDLNGAGREIHRESTALKPSRISFQSLLASSLPLRMRATRVINSLQEEPSYDQVLALGNELASACRDAAIAIDQAAFMGDTDPAGQFASSYCSHLLRRFPLCLHYRYAIKAKTNPLYSYSQKACLEAALDLVSLLEDDLYYLLLLTGGGMFRDIITRGALLIFLELNPEPEADTSIFARKRNRARQGLLLQDAHRVVQYAKDRMLRGDTNVKGYVFLSMLLAQTEARLDGLPTKEPTLKALRESLDTCHNILESMATDTSTKSMYPDFELWQTNNMQSPRASIDADFDFLDDENLNFDFSDCYFPLQ